MRTIVSLGVIVVLGLTGCGSDDRTHAPSPAAPSAPTTPPPAPAAEAPVEEPPALALEKLVPPELRGGQGFTVDDPVPTDGLMAHFTLKSDAGAVEVISVDLLRVRVAEVGALAQLKSVSSTKRFVDAAANAAKRPIESAKNIVLHPVDTVKGIPDGVTRFFGRVERGAKKLHDTVTGDGASGEERAAVAGKQAAGTTADALGYDQERRRLAKQLGVDPYTTNPALTKELDNVAWVSFSGRVGLNVLFAAVVPGSMVMSATNITNDLVWDTPRGDLVVGNATKLRGLGTPDDTVRALQANPACSLSLQTTLVQALGRLAGVQGLPAVVTLVADAGDEARVRFIVSTAELLAGYHERVAPVAAITAEGTIVGWDRAGAIIVPAAVDYVAWTARVRDFAHRPDLAGARRSLWLRGDLSPAARQSFTALGWDIHERWAPPAQ